MLTYSESALHTRKGQMSKLQGLRHIFYQCQVNQHTLNKDLVSIKGQLTFPGFLCWGISEQKTVNREGCKTQKKRPGNKLTKITTYILSRLSQPTHTKQGLGFY
jgi:hypothetical protein